MMKKLLSLFAAIIIATTAWSNGVEIDGLNYILNGDAATVTSLTSDTWNYGNYSYSFISIPDSITYDMRTYRVTKIGDNAFSYCKNLIKVTLTDNITSIGENAFGGCSKLSSINIPYSVTNIGPVAFSNCTSLPVDNNLRYADTHLVQATNTTLSAYSIREGTRSIGTYAFSDCSTMTSVYIPNSVVRFDDFAFCQCASLSSITIPSSAQKIGKCAFKDCSNLHSITIEEGIQDIGDVAFSCSGLTSISIPYSVKRIGEGAFGNCSELTTVILHDNIEIIDNNAFSECSNLQSINFPNSLKSIGKSAFGSCQSITNISLPNSLDNIGEGAFYHTGITSFEFPENIRIVKGSILSDCYNLSSVQFASTIDSIGEYVFNRCSQLNKIVCLASIPPTCNSHSFESVMYYVQIFVPSGSVTAYTQSDGWKRFPNIEKIPEPFGTCGNSLSWEYSSDTLYIRGTGRMYSYTQDTSPWKAYRDSIKYVNMDNRVTSIGDYAFGGCYHISTLTLSNQLNSIREGAFYGCTNLITISLPSSLVSISPLAFQGCSSLTNIKVDSSNKTYSSVDGVLYNLAGNKLIIYPSGKPQSTYNFPSTITEIGSYSFVESRNLKNLTIPDNVTTIGSSAFWLCENLDSINLPNGLKRIENLTFESCKRLKHITIPDSVAFLGFRAFYRCAGLTSMNIPSGVTYIASSCFEGCNFTSLFFEGYTPPKVDPHWHYGAWAGYNMYIYVPCGRVEAYQTNGIYGMTHGSFPYQIAVNSSDILLGFVSKSEPDCYTAETQITATANFGYRFSQWSDGITDNPRIAKIRCDTSFVAEFVNDGGSCGDNLSWKYENGQLIISGTGDMREFKIDSVPWIKYRDSITTIVINQGATSIGNYAFYGCSNKELKMLVLPNSIEKIGQYAFAECSWLKDVTLGTNLEDVGDYAFKNDQRLIYITCLANEPPLLGTFPFANYNAYLKVPCEILDEYKVSLGWMSFYNKSCISADEQPTDSVIITPGTNSVTITWPKDANASDYTIELKKDGVPFCTLTFNAQGQLTNIAFAPSRGNSNDITMAEAVAGGYKFTITSLNPGTKYEYEIDSQNAAGQSVANYTGTFTTTGSTGLGETSFPSWEDRGEACKIIRDGQLLILRDGKTYNAQGGEVK